MAQASSEQAPLLTQGFMLLTGAELAYFTALGMMLPIVALFVTDSLGLGAVAVGVAVGAFSVTALVLRPFAGRLADRVGLRPLLVCGGLLFSAALACHVFATSLWLLLVLRVLLGVAEALFFVAATAALADIAPADRLGEALSYNSLGLYLGITVGPGLGEWVLGLRGFSAAWLTAAGLGLFATGLASRVALTPPSAQATGAETGAGPPQRVPLVPRALVPPGLAFLAGLAGAAGFLGFAAIYARGLGLGGAGGVLFAYGAVVVLGRIAFARLSDRLPAERLSVLALGLCGAGLGVMALWQVPLGLFAGTVVLAGGVVFLTPAFYRLLMSRLDPQHRGAAAATFSVFVDLGLGGGPIMFGVLAKAAGIPGALAVAAAVAATAAVAVGSAASRGSARTGDHRADPPTAHP